MKNPLCHFYIRIYEKKDFIIEEIGSKKVNVSKGFKSKFIKEVEARFVEWSHGAYRLIFPFDGPGSSKAYYTNEKELDIWYDDKILYKEWSENYLFVLNIKVEKNFKSQCI